MLSMLNKIQYPLGKEKIMTNKDDLVLITYGERDALRESIEKLREYARILDLYPSTLYSAGFIAFKINELLDGEQE